MLGTSENVNKGRLQRRCLDEITNPPLFFRLVRQCMGVVVSQLRTFRAKTILWVFVVPKLIHFFTTEVLNSVH